jgi:hypothetical protein
LPKLFFFTLRKTEEIKSTVCVEDASHFPIDADAKSVYLSLIAVDFYNSAQCMDMTGSLAGKNDMLHASGAPSNPHQQYFRIFPRSVE